MGLLETVHVGMRVFDSDGEDLGRVKTVHGPDPKAAAFEERVSSSPPSLIFLGIGSVVGIEPRVPAEMAVELLRQGYIKVAAPHFWGEDYYAAGDAIDAVDAVEGGKVHLSLRRRELDAQGMHARIVASGPERG